MRIGLISDTRASRGEEVPQQVLRAFEGVDLILHAGGIHAPAVLDWLEQIAPVKAVGRAHGHAESSEPLSMEGAGDARIADQQVLEVEGHTLGLVNELWLSDVNDEVLPGIIKGHNFPDHAVPRMVEEYFGAAVDTVVFGRTLYALVEEHQGVLFVNPGSPSLPRNVQKLGSVGLLEITPAGREARIIDLAGLAPI